MEPSLESFSYTTTTTDDEEAVREFARQHSDPSEELSQESFYDSLEAGRGELCLYADFQLRQIGVL